MRNQTDVILWYVVNKGGISRKKKTNLTLVQSLRRWYCEEVVANLTFVHCPSLSFPEV